MFILLLPLVVSELNADEKESVDNILKPVYKIYDLLRYSATVIAILMMLVSGLSYMISASDPMKRENAKNMIGYIVIGLIVIWGAPYLVKFIIP